MLPESFSPAMFSCHFIFFFSGIVKILKPLFTYSSPSLLLPLFQLCLYYLYISSKTFFFFFLAMLLQHINEKKKKKRKRKQKRFKISVVSVCLLIQNFEILYIIHNVYNTSSSTFHKLIHTLHTNTFKHQKLIHNFCASFFLTFVYLKFLKVKVYCMDKIIYILFVKKVFIANLFTDLKKGIKELRKEKRIGG